MKMQTIAKESAETLLYDQCLKRIFKWNLFRHFPHEQKENLDKMRALAGYFGNPQKMFKTIHVAGTNGKGSVSLKCAKSLERAGYKTGLFTSPHICTFRERITVNSQKISEAKVIKFSQMIFEAVEKHQFDLTFFEVVTMIAFLQFAEERVDYAVLECGLGGRLDATNIIEKPECCAIASIGLDHREVLGDTVELIAQEKSGIIKEGVPVVVGPTVT